MLARAPRRWTSRPQNLLLLAVIFATVYWFWPTEAPDTGYKAGEIFEDPQANFERDERNKVMFLQEWEETGKLPGAGNLYGQTLATLDSKMMKHLTNDGHLTPAKDKVIYSPDRPFTFDPYPNYNQRAWLADRAPFVICDGPNDQPLDDVQVFQGHPHDFPLPGMGSYDALNIDGNLCFERDTRLGPYGYHDHYSPSKKEVVRFDKVQWGELQDRCVRKNKDRFDLKGKPNPYDQSGYKQRESLDVEEQRDPTASSASSKGIKEARTAILLRSVTGHIYSENDKQIIRSLVTELNLRSGGQYQVFLFVHVKDTVYDIWEDDATYQRVLHQSVPKEFWDMSILWNDEAVQAMYPKLDPEKTTVHVSQWLSVQKFIQEFPEFDFVWNWELDVRYIGHHYDLLEKLAEFGKKQPRKGLWERNERYYIPSVHGDYDTTFRKTVERASGKDTVWGPVPHPYVTPLGPKPPVLTPSSDNYKWGVDEEADLITVGPIFNPINSGWVSVNELWGYGSSRYRTPDDLPKRATIGTHSRVSKRLLDIMHVENTMGNHISSEMVTQTVSLLHGLKAVFAPIPMYFDRPWEGKSLARWFNPGMQGQSGGPGSATGWGQEGRYHGSTWYYRADPPQRLYLNWMGYEDTDIGGKQWEDINGRPCLPPMLLHPVKDIAPTGPGYKSSSLLPYEM